MKKTLSMTLAAVLLMAGLAACTNNKPFGKQADVSEDSTATTCELDEESQLRILSDLYKNRDKQALQEMNGTEIETEIVDGPGLTIKKPFTVTVKNNSDISLLLKGSIKIAKTLKSCRMGVLGYGGNKQLCYFTPQVRMDGDNIIFTIDLGEHISNSSYADIIRKVNKIVVTSNKEVTERIKKEYMATKAEAKNPEASTLNAALFGDWYAESGDMSISMTLAEKKGDYNGTKGYGHLSASIMYEPAFTYVFTSLTPDGDNIKVHYNIMSEYFTGDPDDLGGEGEWVSEKTGEGDLTLIPQGKKVKIDSKDHSIKNKVLGKVK